MSYRLRIAAVSLSPVGALCLGCGAGHDTPGSPAPDGGRASACR